MTVNIAAWSEIRVAILVVCGTLRMVRKWKYEGRKQSYRSPSSEPYAARVCGHFTKRRVKTLSDDRN
ncbi:hypothetical protein BcepF1.062 [Burkholderia phage BcepF1]|uniref:Uncharacterized protein n=1 Tax=Burkholderia phage BcepF1 TaxID=2886897 RepID=A1YZW6_9CAUD|nr:hypothetical protein BcepF1.062 [Burkholderia phage BcepF1]ABL96793.1 hypothetical protein BcepF1.062 [Burkholderia phage BcepF1]